METIKSYTDLDQSKKLAEILPLESADEFWEYHNKWYSEGEGGEWEGYEDYPRAEPYLEYTREDNEWKEDKSDVPCWSLAALLGVLPEYNLQKTDWGNKTEYKIVVTIGEDNYAFSNHGNPLDACYEMILKLRELNLL